VRQRKEEKGRRLNKGDIAEVLRSEYLPEAVGSSVFDIAICVPVDTAPGEMDGEALVGGNRVPIAPENGEEPVVAAFRISTSNSKDIDYNKDEKVKCLKHIRKWQHAVQLVSN
jgi:hypothetical protein